MRAQIHISNPTTVERAHPGCPHPLSESDHPLTKIAKVIARVGLLGTLCGIGIATAQTLPSTTPSAAGAGLPSTPSVLIPSASALAPAMQSLPDQQLLPVKGFQFVGNTVFANDVLEGQLQLTLAEQGVTFEDLSLAVDRISRFYREQGYVVARAYLPQQSRSDGIIQINVLEGLRAKRPFFNVSDVKSERVKKMLETALCGNQTPDCVGSLVTDEGNERAVRLLNDLPGATASALIEPGLAIGTSELYVAVQPSQRPTGNFGIDNYGSQATGVYRANVSQDFNNLRGEGDVLSLSGSASKTNIWSGSLSYSVMAGYTGTRVGLAYGHGQYLLGDAFTALGARGESDSIGAFIAHPIIRHRDGNLSVRAGLDYKVLKDSIEKSNLHFDKRNNTYNFGLSGDKIDTFLGGGYNIFSVGLVGGNLRLIDKDSQTGDLQAKTAGGYSKVNFTLSRQQAITGPITFYAAVSGQIANKNLDGSEKIGLGGPGGVRGYPAGEAAGDKGAIANFEMRHTQALSGGSTLTYSAFVDRGWVQTNAQPWLTGGVNTQSRTSGGFGLLWIKPYGYTLRALWGKHGTGPGQTSTAVPGSSSQFWLQGNKSF